MTAKPNFFIVGAPKCGTTALYEYLRLHPNIYMPEVKEPHYFAKDLGNYPMIKTMEAYTELFAASGPEHIRVGEASVYYLRSAVALPGIREFDPDARIIAMFRNPMDMVYSFHSQLLYVSEEAEPDFATAWRLQERRRQGLDIPPTCREPWLLQYAEVGRFGTQAERLLSIFPREQVKLIVYDDFARSPRQVYEAVVEFLGLPHDDRAEFPRINENKRARITWLRNFFQKPPPALRKAVRRVKQAAGGEGISAVKRKLVAMNTVKEDRPPMSPELRAELAGTFRGEIDLLSRILDRDLRHWT